MPAHASLLLLLTCTHTDSFEVAHSAEVERIRSTTAGDMPEDKDMTRLGYAMIPAPIAEAVRENAAAQAVVVKQLTLVLLYCEKQGKILLAMKKRGFGEGKYNGFGGKVEPGETILEGALREFREECRASVPADKLVRRGVLTFVFRGSHKVMQVHLFTGSPDAMVGEAQETEEMRPEWFSLDAVPFERMWADDRFCFPPTFISRPSTLHPRPYTLNRPSLNPTYTANGRRQDLLVAHDDPDRPPVYLDLMLLILA